MGRTVNLLKNYFRKIKIALSKYLLSSFEKYPLDSMLRMLNSSNIFSFNNVKLPNHVNGYEDLSFLFWNCPINRGIIRMDFDEAATLYKLIKRLKSPVGVEIGRNKGGSTILIASAIKDGGKLLSIDINPEHDGTIKAVLGRLGLGNQVELLVGNSQNIQKNITLDFLFIDGDHSYQGAKMDHLNWGKWVKNGGYIIHHDMGNSRPFSTQENELKKLRDAILMNQAKEITIEKEVGSLIIFKRISDSWTYF